MLFTPHILTGAAIGSAVGNPFAAFALGLVSHHVLDAVIHFDPGSFRIEEKGPNYINTTSAHFKLEMSRRDWIIISADFITAAALFAALFWNGQTLSYPLLAGMLGAVLPDVLDSSPLWSPSLRARFPALAQFHRFHAFFHWTATREQIPVGLATQTLCVGIALWILSL